MMSRAIPGLAFLGCLMILGVASAEDGRVSQAKAIGAIQTLDGHVWFESEWVGTEQPPLKTNPGAKPEDKSARGNVVAVTFDVADYVEFDTDDLILYRNDPPTKDGELRWLEAFPDVRWLSLSHTGVTDEGMKRLIGLKSLRVLKLCNTAVTDAAAEHLAKLRGLTTVDVRETKLTAAGAQKLQRLLPNAVVLHESKPLLAILTAATPGDGAQSWRASDDGGKLAYRFSLDKQEYVEGEPILVTFTVVNVGSETLNFAAPRLPNSPTGFLSARLESGGSNIVIRSLEKAGSIVELKPKASHNIQFALGEHSELPHFSEIAYSRSVHFPNTAVAAKHLRRGVYQLHAQYSGRRGGSEESTPRINRALNERNVWPGMLTPPSLTFAVLSDGTPERANRVESLTCEIKTNRTRLQPGESVIVTRSIRNGSEDARRLYRFDFMNDNLCFHWINRVTGQRGIQPLCACGVSAPRAIAGGETSEERLTYQVPDTGDYDFFISCAVPGSEERLVSNTIAITIAPEPPDSPKSPSKR